MQSLVNFRGELAALTAALIWAFASIIYTGVGKQLSPLLLNLVKGLMAIALLLLTLGLQGRLFPAVGPGPLGLLLLSGAIGIGIGDTAYFQALNDIGPRRTLVIESLAPALSTVFAWVFLQEKVPLTAGLGIALTIAGIILVVMERPGDRAVHATASCRTPPSSPPSSPWLRGIGCGLIAALGQATGAVLSRAAVGGSTIDPLWSTLVRLLAGVAVLGLGLLWQQRRVDGQPAPSAAALPQAIAALQSPRLLAIVAGTAFASTYLGIWLQQISLKYAATGIAQALSSTSPLFVTGMTLAMGERVERRAIAGVLIALGGIWLLFWRP